MLYSIEVISDDFKSMEICSCEEKIIALKEGKYHIGDAAVVRFVGRK